MWLGQRKTEVQHLPFYQKGFHNEEEINRMVYNRFGNTEIHTSLLGLGGSELAFCHENDKEQEAIETVIAAIKSGINYIDTAPFYGQGKAEIVLGKALRHIPRSAYYLATKVGRYGPDTLNMFDFTADRTLDSVKESLNRLGVDYFDILQVHDLEFAPSIDVIIKETLPALQILKDMGKTKFIGITGYPLSKLKCFSIKDQFPYLANLLAIVPTLPVSTSSCERGFSTMNIIKNKLCSNLKQDSINSLMFINLNEHSLKDFNPEKSIDKYLKAKSQREVLEKSPVKIDAVLSYCRYTLFDDTLSYYIPYFKEKNLAIINAASLGMGLLTHNGPPDWHPAGQEIKDTCQKVADYCKTRNVNISKLAFCHSLSQSKDIHVHLVGMENKTVLKANLESFWNGLSDHEMLVEDDILGHFKQIQEKHWENKEVTKYWENIAKETM